MASQASPRISGMIQEARAYVGVVENEVFDKRPYLFNCPNGTVDLQTGKLRPHAAKDLLTQLCKVPYDPAARCPQFDAFLRTIMLDDEEMIRYIGRIFGLATIGELIEQNLFIFHGEGANGKTTLVRCLLDVMGGSYAIQANRHTLLRKAQSDRQGGAVMDLDGARLAVVTEIEEGERLDEAAVKGLTGGDRQRDRKLYENNREFDPTATVVMAVNDMPEIRGTNHAIMRRIKKIPFDHVFEEEKGAPRINWAKKLATEEGPGILAWLVRSARDYLRDGMEEPEKVNLKTEEYFQDQDSVGQFKEQNLIESKYGELPATPLYKEYVEWMKELSRTPLSLTAFGKRMKALLGPEGEGWKRSNGIIYIGVDFARNAKVPVVDLSNVDWN
jgi:putative DNA primase/helicase